MQVVIRADSSYAIGSGHVIRCLSLADELIKYGYNVLFICRELPGHQIELIRQRGFTVYSLPFVKISKYEAKKEYSDWLGATWQEDYKETKDIIKINYTKISWLIVDHYTLDYEWESAFRKITNRILVIDDLANRKHDCDLLLDQNLYPDAENRYTKLLGKNYLSLLGPKYALLRPEFFEMRNQNKISKNNLFRILIFFGGSDATNETTKALAAIESLNDLSMYIDVVVGVAHAHKEEIKKICAKMNNVSYHSPAKNMAELMLLADLAISGGGSTTWERCCLGLPSLTINVVEHQMAITAGVENIGAAINLGLANDVSVQLLCSSIRKVMSDTQALENMRLSGMQLVDGLGVSRVVEAMNKLN